MFMMSFRCLRSRLGEAGVGAMVNGRGDVGVMVMLDWRVSASLFPVFLFFCPLRSGRPNIFPPESKSRPTPNPFHPKAPMSRGHPAIPTQALNGLPCTLNRFVAVDPEPDAVFLIGVLMRNPSASYNPKLS